MSSLTRLIWALPCLVAACGNTSVHGDTSDSGGAGGTGGVHGRGGSKGLEDPDGGGPLASGGGGARGGFSGSGGFVGAGGFFGGDGSFPGAGGFVGAGGFFGSDGGFFGGTGGFPGSGGFFGGDGGFFGGTGGMAGAPGSGGQAGSGGQQGSGGGLPVDPTCCEAIPFCRAGYDQVSGPGECGHGDICYEATACCSTIWCKAHPDEDAGVCARGAPPGVHYISANASVCDHRAWTCQTNTYQYWDTCGCGCSQDPGCPASVDCKTVPKDALCTDTATCPFTDRTP